MFSSSTNYNKLKTNLRLVINRLKLLEKKKTEIGQKARKEIADYIAGGKDDRARIRVEHIIREDYLVEAMELLEMYCDLLLARFGLIQTQKELDPGLEEAIASLIWAAPRLQTDCQELKVIADQFIAKYDKEFGQACRTNALNNVNEKVMHKLGVQAPPKILIERYMIEIAKTYNVPFEPDQSVMGQDEIFAAENLLIEFGDSKKGGANGGGMLQPQQYTPQAPSQESLYNPQKPPRQEPMQYPPPQPATYKPQPPVPNVPPAGGVPFIQPPGGAPYKNTPGGPSFTPPVGGVPNPSPSASGQDKSSAYTKKPPSSKSAADNIDSFPDLPAVPNGTLGPPGSSSTDGEDVDFDDLSRRFEELKKKK